MDDWRRGTAEDSLRGTEAPRPKPGHRFQTRRACLPAIATVAAISAAPATATMAAASAAVPAAPATAAAAALCLGTCFIHYEVSPPEILTVQGVHGLIRFFVIRNFNESEAARLSREPIANQIDAGGSYADLRKPLVELVFRRGKRKITYIELLRLLLLLPGT